MQVNEGSTQTNEGSDQGNDTPTIETLTAQIQNLTKLVEATEASKARVLSEAKATKEKLGKAATEKDELKKALLMKEGDKDRLIEMERTEKEELKTRLSGVTEKLLKTQIRSTIQEFASDAFSLDDVLNQVDHAPLLKDAVDLETLTVDYDKAKKFADEVRKAKPYLFKTASQPGVVTRKPGMSAPARTKPLEEMTAAEIEADLRREFSN
jgi:hypothetical protein